MIFYRLESLRFTADFYENQLILTPKFLGKISFQPKGVTHFPYAHMTHLELKKSYWSRSYSLHVEIRNHQKMTIRLNSNLKFCDQLKRYLDKQIIKHNRPDAGLPTTKSVLEILQERRGKLPVKKVA